MSFNKILLVVAIGFFLIFSIGYRLDNKYWWLEDEIHPVQCVEESKYGDQITYLEIDKMYSDSTYYEKYKIESERPKPYTLITIYKGTKIRIGGDMEYLKKYKCKQKEEVIKVYKQERVEYLKQKKATELLENKKEAEMKAIVNSNCK